MGVRGAAFGPRSGTTGWCACVRALRLSFAQEAARLGQGQRVDVCIVEAFRPAFLYAQVLLACRFRPWEKNRLLALAQDVLLAGTRERTRPPCQPQSISGHVRLREHASAAFQAILTDARRGIVHQARTGVTCREIAEALFARGRLERDWFDANKSTYYSDCGPLHRPGDPVFSARTGGAMDGSAVGHRDLKDRSAAGLRDLRFHDLRHTLGSLAIKFAAVVEV